MAKRINKEEILELYSNGYSPKEIANILGISPMTVYSKIPKDKERKEKKEKIKEELGLKTGIKSIKDDIEAKFSFLRDIKVKNFAKANEVEILQVDGRTKEGKRETYIVFVCKGNIEFVIQKKGCKFEERYDIAYMDKLKKLIAELVDKLTEPMTEEEIKILLSPEYTVDLHYVDKKKNHFILRAWKKGGKSEKEKKFIPIINSTRDDIYNVAKEIVEVRRKVFKK